MPYPAKLSSESLRCLEAGQRSLDENALLTEIATTCFSLPAYFRFKIQLVRERERETRLNTRGKASAPRALAGVPPDQRVLFRRVAALEIIDPLRPPVVRAYTPPLYQVEVDGFWRRLPDPTARGRGQNGEPVAGKTWVKAHLRWRGNPPVVRTVYVKSSVALARAHAAAMQASTTSTTVINVAVPPLIDEPNESPGTDAGWLYVMRCPAMDDDIYKVGWTAKEPSQRAEELSRATGVPLYFAVVESWPLENARLAERLAHDALSAFRLSSRKEFFKARYETIRQAIESVVPTGRL